MGTVGQSMGWSNASWSLGSATVSPMNNITCNR
jgi:hypothetical protein